jgi:hypothetical protein
VHTDTDTDSRTALPADDACSRPATIHPRGRRPHESAGPEVAILGLAVIAAAMLLGSACSDDDGTGVPVPALEIRTATGGTELDPDGYTVTVDGGAARPIGLTDTLF